MATTAAASAPAGVNALPAWGYDPARHSGPAVARLFQRLFGLVALCAWLSLTSQVGVLIGSRGLLPARERFEQARQAGVGFSDEPSLLWFLHDDTALVLLAGTGCALSLLALCGLRPRLCFALSAPLYLSFAIAGSDFTAFQWDNMLVETALLAACLPAHRHAPLAHFAMRALLFKLYFESGIAKWQSHLHDWHDGSAMSFYYETAPLPAALAFYAHQLPAALHALASWGALLLELGVPLLIWGPRRARLAAFAAFTGFQLVNTATANYGFFTYISLALHVFLLSDADVERARAALTAWAPWLSRVVLRRAKAVSTEDDSHTVVRSAVGASALGLWLLASTLSALIAFAPGRPPRALLELQAIHAPLRVANVYHLFGHVTRQRIEPQFQTRSHELWTEHDLRYKPGAPERSPPYVAPHQPRVDFRLWFYGLGFQRGMPRYVHNLLERLCHDPEAVAELFEGALPRAPDAVRIAFYRYHFNTLEQRARTGAAWNRTLLGTLPPRTCR